MTSQTFTQGYAYNPDGSRSGLSLASQSGSIGSFSYGYDGIGRLTSLTNPFSEAFGWTYDDGNRLLTQQTPVSTTTYAYNALSQLTGLVNRKRDAGQTLLSQFGDLPTTPASNRMTYDAAGNRLTLPASVPGYSAHSGTVSYGYDSKDQLTQETSTRNGGYTQNQVFDPAGNPTTFRSASGIGYNPDNQITPSSAFAYDGNGNATTLRGDLSAAYNAENKATTTTLGNGSVFNTVTSTFRPDGLRASKSSHTYASALAAHSNTTNLINPGGDPVTWFVYDGLIPVLEVDGNGSVSEIHTSGANGLLSRRSTTAGAAGRDYVFDPSGTAQTFVKSDGTSGGVYVASDGFGQINASAGGSDSYLGFGAQWGYYTDAETGLALCGHRFYDSGTARWLNRLFTGVRENMKNFLLALENKNLLRKRSIIETVFDQLKNIAQIEHSCHRSVTNFLVNLIAALASYSLQPKNFPQTLSSAKIHVNN